MAIPFEGAARDHLGSCDLEVIWVLQDAVAEDQAGGEGVDADAMIAEFPRKGAREGHDRALRGDVMCHSGRLPLEGRT